MSYLTHVSLVVGLILVASPTLGEERRAERPSVSKEEPRNPVPLERRLPSRATVDEKRTKTRQESASPEARSGLGDRRNPSVTRTPARPGSAGTAPRETTGARDAFGRTRTETEDQRVETQRGTPRISGERRPGERRVPSTPTNSSDRRDAAGNRSPWAAERLERVVAPKARTPGVAIPQSEDASAARLPDDSSDAWTGKDSGLAMPEQKGLDLAPSLSGASSDSGIGESSAGVGPGGPLPGSSSDGTRSDSRTGFSTNTSLEGPNSTAGSGDLGTSPDAEMDIGALDSSGPRTPSDSTSSGAGPSSAPALEDRNSTSGADPRLAEETDGTNDTGAEVPDNAESADDTETADADVEQDNGGSGVEEEAAPGYGSAGPKTPTVRSVAGRLMNHISPKPGNSDNAEGNAVVGVRGREAEGGGNLGPTPEQLKEKLASQRGGADGTTNPTGATPVLSQEEAFGMLRSQAGTPDVLVQTQEGAVEEGSLDAGVSSGVQPGAVDPDETE